MRQASEGCRAPAGPDRDADSESSLRNSRALVLQSGRRSGLDRRVILGEYTSLRVAIDTGGTFTDCVYLEGGQLRVLKLFSTPADPAVAVLEALRRIAPGAAVDLRHGTTLGTNAMLERRGARVAFVATAGLEDTLAIGRQTRAALYDWFAAIPDCLVPEEMRFGVTERVSPEGAILHRPSEAELQALALAVRGCAAEAAAVSLLFSFANAETEKRVEAELLRLGIPVSVSHRILPEFREYERASTRVVCCAWGRNPPAPILDRSASDAARRPP